MNGQREWYVSTLSLDNDLTHVQPFEQITSLTDVAEGTIVRVITRLDETCREVRDAARVIGDAELFKKMEECQTKIKRDSMCYSFSNTARLMPCSSRIRRQSVLLAP